MLGLTMQLFLFNSATGPVIKNPVEMLGRGVGHSMSLLHQTALVLSSK
jgi:hypothetical protein